MTRINDLIEALKEAFAAQNPVALALAEAATSPDDIDHFLKHIAIRMSVGPSDYCVVSHHELMELRVKAGYYEDMSAAAIAQIREICVAMDANAGFIDDAVVQAINNAYERGSTGQPLQPPVGTYMKISTQKGNLIFAPLKTEHENAELWGAGRNKRSYTILKEEKGWSATTKDWSESEPGPPIFIKTSSFKIFETFDEAVSACNAHDETMT